MKYLSVCSGLGGAELAFTPLGWECVGVCEIEPSSCAVLKERFPNVHNFGDFTKIGVEDVGTIDLLVGGTPCQDFSVAGLRAGMDGDRGQLTIEFARLAERLRPRWLVWENVPGILSVDGGRAFGTFLGILGKFGYGFSYRILDAQYAGVPQRRRRVFLVGHLGDWRPSAAVLFEQHCLSGYPPPSKETRESVAGCLKGGSGKRGWPDPSDGNGGGLVDVAGTIERGFRDRRIGIDGTGKSISHWPAEIVSTLDTHFGDKQGLEDQHINSGASHFVPGVVGTMACNTGPNGHDAGNFQSNQGVDSGYVIPVCYGIDGEQNAVEDGFGTLVSREKGGGFEGAVAFQNTGKGYWKDGDITGKVRTPEGGDSLKSTIVAFTQNSREEVRVIGEDGDISGSLSAETGTHQTTYLAFDWYASQSQNFPVTEECPPLKTTMQPAVAMINMQGSKGNSVAQEDGPSFTLNAMHGHDVHAVAFHTSGYGGQVDKNVAQTLQASDAKLSNQVSGVIQKMQVRRLTPTECERLQGVPDGHTLVPFNGKPMADGNRYKMIGNGFAIPCVKWIGKRIQMVEDMLNEHS